MPSDPSADASPYAADPAYPTYPVYLTPAAYPACADDVEFDLMNPECAPMHVIETFVDIVRKAKGKPTYADLDPASDNFESQLDDFVADVFRAMGAGPR